MYALKPLKGYLREGAADDPRAQARMERILDAIGYPMTDVVTFSAKTLPEVSQEVVEQWPPEEVQRAPTRRGCVRWSSPP